MNMKSIDITQFILFAVVILWLFINALKTTEVKKQTSERLDQLEEVVREVVREQDYQSHKADEIELEIKKLIINLQQIVRNNNDNLQRSINQIDRSILYKIE